MEIRKVGMAMIGCGQIARAHLRAIAKIPNAELVGAMDIAEEKAQIAADEYGGKLHTKVDSVLTDGEVDAVVLALPHHLHYPVAVKSAQAGKHVLVEKPMALNVAEARGMVDAADAAGICLMVGQSTRFRPEVWTAKSVIDSGKLGKMQQCICQRAWFLQKLSTKWRYSRQQCGGLYLPLFGSHDVDMILWLMNDAPVRVHSLLRSYTSVTDSESDGVVSIELAKGGIVSLSFSMSSPIARHSALFVGTEGAMLIENGKLLVNKEEVPLDKSESQFVPQMQEFVDAILANREPIASGRDVLPTMAVLDAASESSETRSIVEIVVI
jgi:predicted dehydrogenase